MNGIEWRAGHLHRIFIWALAPYEYLKSRWRTASLFVHVSFFSQTSLVFMVTSSQQFRFCTRPRMQWIRLVYCMGPVGRRNRSLKAVVFKSIGVLWFLPVHTPTSCLITLSVWCDVQTCIMSYRESDQLIWCTVFSWFKEAGFSYFSYIQRLTLSAAFIYYAHRSSLWCQPGHYLWQCLVRLPLPLI